MSEQQLRRQLFWRTCGWGTLIGGIGGALYGLLIPSLGLPIGIFFSGVLGFIFGVINGQALSRVTLGEFYPLTNLSQYQATTKLQAKLVSGFGIIAVSTLFLFLTAVFGKLGPLELQLILLCPVAPAVIAGAATLQANRQAVAWYQRRMKDIVR